MSHERGQRTPGTPGKDAAAASSPTKKKMEYMTGVMPPGIKKCGLPMLPQFCNVFSFAIDSFRSCRNYRVPGT
jgi:hypothetical protein